MINRVNDRALLWVVALVYAALGVVYSLSTPPLESSDEFTHYPVVQYIQVEQALPVLDPENPGLWLQEAAQPPLYYALMALLTSWIDTSDLADIHQVNPHAFIGNPDQVANKNLIIHQPEQEAFPWRGSILAVYVIRLLSIGLGIGTILLTALLGRTLFDSRVGLLAAVLTALNPMFLFVSAAVNNDSLSAFLGTAGLYLIVRLWQDTPDPRTHWRRYVGLGIVLGLGILSKLSMAGLLALAGLALAWLAWRQRRMGLLFPGGILTAAVALALSGWWFIRNLQLYHDPTGLNVFVAVQGIRDSPISLAGWIGEFGTFYRTFWGLFGGINIAAPDPVYWIYNLAALTGMVGLLFWFRKKHSPQQSGVWLLITWPLILFLLLVRWTTVYYSFQGRLIFPALGAINVLWAIGVLSWYRGKVAHIGVLALSAWMLAVAIVLPWAVIRPAYSYPDPLPAVPTEAQFGPITYQAEDGAIQLVGVEMEERQRVTPAGDPVKVALYWQANDPVERDYVSSVHLIGRAYSSAGQVDRYPGWGMIPTSDWETGQVWRDVYHVRVNRDAVGPTRLRVSVGLYDTQESTPLSPIGPDGTPMELVIVGEARLGRSEGEPQKPTIVTGTTLSDGITLAGYNMEPQPATAGDSLALTLFWDADSAPTQDYTVFVHLLDRDGSQLAGADGPPVEGDYPTTWWEAGDQVEDLHVVPLPTDLVPGDYIIDVGLYIPATGLRALRLDNGDSAIHLPAAVVEGH
jgi:4-amino-4-deoxy-L-arabinose transferase-like glycosyltransferase